MVHCGYEPTAADDAVRHPLKALMVKLRGIRTDGPMAPEIALDKQRPAEFVFSRHVEDAMATIAHERAVAPGRPTAAEFNPSSSCPGLDPGIHHYGWTRGSSPRVTDYFFVSSQV